MMKHIDQCLFDLVDESEDLRHYFEGQAEVFAECIRKRSPARAIRVLDIAGKSNGLPLGLSLYGYEVYSTCEIHQIPENIASRLRTPIKPYLANDSEKFDVVVAANNALADHTTEAELQQTLRSAAKRLNDEGLLLLTMRYYDQLLRTRPGCDKPCVLSTANGRCIHLVTWQWMAGNCLYTQDHYLIQHQGDQCMVTHFATTQRAWRRAEIDLALSQAGFRGIQYQSIDENQMLICASKDLS